jgi:hypothetical protein|tara:strand:- start:598 stop:921 length:324 start_codon:yes stop_codon:yes gene_type:complete
MMELLQKLFGGSGSAGAGPTSSNKTFTSGGTDLSNRGTAFNQSAPQQTAPQQSSPYGTSPGFAAMLEKLKQGRKRQMNPAPQALGGSSGGGQVMALRQLMNNMIGPR